MREQVYSLEGVQGSIKVLLDLGYTGNVADMSATCRQDMTFRRDWRRQGGCRRHSGGCRVSAAVGKIRTYVIGTDGRDDGCGRMRAVKARVLRVLVGSPEVSFGLWEEQWTESRLGRRRRAQADKEEERDRARPGHA
ncbi:hypothetical protein THAOC_30174, partial [Thalassiosira oceanica]